jgi:hypothetical protein
MVQSQQGQVVHETLSRKYPSQKGLMEWFKEKPLSSSPSTTKKKVMVVEIVGGGENRLRFSDHSKHFVIYSE